VQRFLVYLFLPVTPDQVVPHTMRIRLGPLAVLFSARQVLDEILSDGALDQFFLLVELTNRPFFPLGVVLFSVVLPGRVIDPVVGGEGKCGHHGLKFHWSRIHHGLVVVRVAGVTGSSSITLVGHLVVVN
jgi:hypothetical protein